MLLFIHNTSILGALQHMNTFQWTVKKKKTTKKKNHSFLSMSIDLISKLKWKIKQHAVVILLTAPSAKCSASKPHTLSLKRSSEDDLKEYFLFPIELLPMTSAGSLFSDSTVCTNAAFKAGAMNTHLSRSLMMVICPHYSVSVDKIAVKKLELLVMVFHFTEICLGKKCQKTILFI